MDERRDRLPATGWAVLGVLSHAEELSGYDVKKWADHVVAFFYVSPALSQIYGELRRLEELGYVVSRAAPQDELRNKRLYRITEPGREALRHWVNHAPVDPTVLKHNLAMRVWLGHLADQDRLRDLAERHVAETERALGEVRTSLLRSQDRPAWSYPVTVLRWCERYYRSELALTRELLTDLGEAPN
ncbi:helix-turn-helix transcriptional regulator [Solihabitans fulvus]|uniref:helix-turn-helix transcriptional regulator n=1 Tax=Solihabitans fulvus TaxID=1892852 RepID=UPI001CB768E9|nr:helix-turn-helix transcriptional regulator [Solihabitans fulvus]